MLNQIIYTFNRRELLILEKKHGQSWSWSETSQSYLNPTLSRDYGDMYMVMILNQISDRVLKFL